MKFNSSVADFKMNLSGERALSKDLKRFLICVTYEKADS